MEKIHNIPIDYVTKKGNKFSWKDKKFVYYWRPDGMAEILGHADTYKSFKWIADSYEKNVKIK